MKLDLPLAPPVARATMLCAVLALCGWLLYLVLCDFIVGALTDERIRMTADTSPASFITAPFNDDRLGVHPDVVAAAARYLPNSPRLHMRLAEYQRYREKDQWDFARYHAKQAIRLSPHDYRPRLQLAAIELSREDVHAAEQSVRAALQLAPGNLEAHWQLGSLLLSKGDLAGSLEAFRVAASGHEAYFLAALKLVWDASGENADAVRAITPDSPKERIGLAQFLLEQSRPLESAAVFRQIDHEALLGDPKSSHYLNSLIAAGHFALARDLWCGLRRWGSEAPEETTNLMWNGGFESGILVDFAQFDWSIRTSGYARISIDPQTAHSGRRSLRVDFVGRDTTRLEEEIRQLTLVRPGTRYRLHYYVKTEGLSAPEGPRVVLFGASSREWIAASDPAPAGSNGWQQRTLEFAASSPALTVAIQQRPRFSYEEPTRGTVWFDDFEVREIHAR